MSTSTDLRAAIEEMREFLSPGAGRLDPQEALERARESWTGKLTERLGSLPWWVISSIVHGALLFLASLIAVAVPQGPPEITEFIQPRLVQPPKTTFKPRQRRPLFAPQLVTRGDDGIDASVELPKDATPDRDETIDPHLPDENAAHGDIQAIGDIPQGGAGFSDVGVGPGGLRGVYGLRDPGGRRKGIRRFKGSPVTESAVEAALAWLARHQESDGHWDAKKWEATGTYDGAMTGLATLAFLGAGYDEKTPSPYRHKVRQAVQWMIADQNEDGSFRSSRHCRMYGHGLMTLALCEDYGMAGNAAVGRAAQKAVDYIVEAQGQYEGWNYLSKHKRPGRNDTSVTGWQLMALKSARIAGLRVDPTGFHGCSNWLERATDPRNGSCAYAGLMESVKPGAGSLAMTSAGVLMRQFMGAGRADEVLRKACDHLVKHPPEFGSKAQNFYYWYYGTLCMFQMGGDHWRAWNAALKKTLPGSQRRGKLLDGSARDVDGSWDPSTHWCRRGGRVMSTALGALCLEVYYRYLPIHHMLER